MEFCGDVETKQHIMQAKSALKCKSLGKEIKNCDSEKWNQVTAEKCFPGILSKFQQNAGISSFLKNTGTKTILECCYDEVWGNGIPLSNPDCINLKKYKGQGILGSMLEQVRETLLAHASSSNKENIFLCPKNPSSSHMMDTPLPSHTTSSALSVETIAMTE